MTSTSSPLCFLLAAMAGTSLLAAENSQKTTDDRAAFPDAKAAISALQKLAAEIAREPPEGKPLERRRRVEVVDRQIIYHIGDAPDMVPITPADHFSVPFEVLVRSAEVGEDCRHYFREAVFWKEPLHSVDAAAEEMVHHAYEIKDAAEREKADKKSAFNVRSSFGAFVKVLGDFADEHGFRVLAGRGLPQPYDVEVQIVPNQARVRKMFLLDYKLCQQLNRSLDDKWTELPAGHAKLLGRYRYIADWPLNLNGRVEGNIEVKSSDPVVFQPKPNP